MSSPHANADHVRFTSWGRTRSPKNILSGHRAGINANGDGQPLDLNDASATPASVTCATENQRFLHVVLSAAADTPKLTVTGLMYAAGSTEMSLRTVHNGAAELTAANQAIIIDISGIDRVKFTLTDNGGDDGTDATCTFFAACSTF